MNIKASLISVVIGMAIISSMAYALKRTHSAKVRAEVYAEQQELKIKVAEARMKSLRESVASAEVRRLALAAVLQDIRDREAVATAVLADRDRLRRLTQAKPGLLERKARRATTAVWRSIEMESGE